MNEREKETIEFFKECILKDHLFEEDLTLSYMKNVLNLLEKKDKQINLIYDFLYKFGCKFSGSFMKALSEDGFDIKKCDNCKNEICNCKNCIKQYFERKVEE